MKIALVANTSWYLYNFRRNLMGALKARGHNVVAIGSSDGYEKKLKAEGFASSAISFNSAGVNPFREIQTVRELRRHLRDDFDIVLSWTPKGNIYAALALIGRKSTLIVNVSGLGRAFIHRTWVTKVMRQLLKLTLARAYVAFFQNNDDLEQFIDEGLVDELRCQLLPGSGVDLAHFSPLPARPQDNQLRVLMVSRLIWSKGIQEYVDAARALRASDSHWHFQLVGPLDGSARSGVPVDQLHRWISEGFIEYLGVSDDVRDLIAAADCLILPSYREGLPRVMLEAAAMARPIITTDAPGCRDCVDEGVNGFLFRTADHGDLMRALNMFKNLTAEARTEMGIAGRRKVEAQFDERIVIERYFSILDGLS